MPNAAIDIAAPRDRVFHYVTDPRYLPDWQPDVIKPPALPTGGLSVGTLLDCTVDEDGRAQEVRLKVVELVPNEQIVYASEHPSFLMESEFRLTGRGAQTRVSHAIRVQPKGMGRFFLPRIKNRLQAKVEARLDMLRRIVESQELGLNAGPAA